MLCSKNKLIVSAAFMLLVACCMTNFAVAGNSGGRSARIFDAAIGQGTRGLLATLDGRLPLEPRLPIHTVICVTLRANLTSAVFASPTTTDPDVDSIAAVTANPVSSNPDTVRIQAALNSCHKGGVVKLADHSSNACLPCTRSLRLQAARIRPNSVTALPEAARTLLPCRGNQRVAACLRSISRSG